MVITSEQLTAFVGSLLWPLFRVGALMLSAPVFGARTVPHRVRAGLSVLIALAMSPALPAPPPVDVFSATSLLIIVQQILIGVMMGLALQIVMSAIITGGQLIAMQMGLGFAAMIDPQNGAQTPVLSQFYVVMVVLIFVTLNGHLVMFEVLRDSFISMPIGKAVMPLDGIWQLIHWSGQIFAGAVGMAIPAIASLLIVNFAFGIMTRAAPQMNIFAIGFPITLILGFGVILATLPSVLPHSTGLFNEAYHVIRTFLAGAH
ncbi:MAG: flagellar biosynthetic protein FliR [Gammaproteobacteria bacterium]|nr:flagellar biosynthetic protein FliR [Gammaproteobacteria bacterium]